MEVKLELPEKRRSLLWKGMVPALAGLALGLPPMAALAQDEAPSDEETEAEQQEAPDVDRMVVTGSRLMTDSNLIAPNPVLTVGEAELESRGITRIEDLTNSLPQVFAGQTAEVSNGATGTATLNLRGLGAIRTLPLIDGRRLPFGSAQSSPANIDNVPSGLIDRIEIVTGGASAVYGSDAIGGVVNFILKDNFEGLEIDVQGGFHQAGNDSDLFEAVLNDADVAAPGGEIDGREINVSLTMGANTADGRGNVTMFFNYENLKPITQDNRIESACALGGSASGPEGIGCIGSGNFRLFAGPGNPDGVFQEEDGEFVPFVSSPRTTFNFGPRNFFQRPIERFQFYTKADYEITDDIELFADISFMNNSSDAQIAESATFGVWSINCDNPLIQPEASTGIPLTEVFGCVPDPETGVIPDQFDNITASHRNVEGGPRNSELDLTTWRTIGGVRGTIFDHYDFELFGQFSRVLDTDISEQDLIIDNVQDAFFVVEDENGNPVCRSGNPGCVPLDIFTRGPNGETNVTDEAREFVEGIGLVTGEVDQQVFGGTIQTDLGRFGVQSPFADSGLGLLFGGEFRQDELVSKPDQISQQPDGGFTGVGGPTLPVSGEVRVREAFVEGQLPLINDVPAFEQLAVGGAYRHSDYTTRSNALGTERKFDTDTWHVYVNWTPIDQLRLRGQFQRAIRAPNVIELFTGQGTGLPDLTGNMGLFDPCASANPIRSFEECARTGVTEEQFGRILDVIAGQTQSITGGNPDLDPEESDTWTFGAVITPDFVPGLTLSADWFNIELDDAIADGIGAQTILDNCLDTGNPAFCNLINRGPTGSLVAGQSGVGFQATNINIATLETTGIDLQAVYDLDLWNIGLEGAGSVRFDYAATILDELRETPFPGADVIECAGFFLGECDIPNPEYRHRMITSWQTPWDVTVNATWRFFSSTDNQSGDVTPVIDREIDTIQYLDLSANWIATDALEFRAGVNNIFGEQPPVITSAGPASFGNGNTFPGVFDAQGRFIFFGATYRL